ncbi:MAG: ParB/RepB/Spo0J family partition protein [Deltaproteobacteria bacterium]|nr:ParB/RepB/Spo0J family partition protein [Deltaproteobacteria bacterium]
MPTRSRSQLAEVRLEGLVLSPTNPRTQCDPSQQEELTASIREQGVLVPLLCRLLPDQQLEVVAGARRYHAATAAGLDTVPVIVRAMTDTEALEVQLIENLQRADVHPLDEGQAYHTLRTTAGYDLARLAAKVGKSRSYVAQRLQLATLSADAQAAFREDRISTGHALLIARLPPRDHAVALRACTRRRWMSTGEIEQLIPVAEFADWIAQTLHLDLRRAPFSTADAALWPEAGACLTCPKRTGFSPELFPDIAHQETCTDRACWARKLDAYLTHRKQTLAATGSAPVELSTAYVLTPRAEAGGMLPQSQWVQAEPRSCAHSTHGLIVDGREVGTALTVCTAPHCTTHPRSGAGGGSTTRDARRAQRHQWRVEEQIRHAVCTEILRQVDAPLPRAVMNRFVVTCFARLWFEYQKQVLARYGWTHGSSQGMTAIVDTQVQRLSDAELAQFMVTLMLIGELHPADSRHEDSPLLDELAAHYHVDIPALRKQVTSSLEAKHAKPRATGARARVPAQTTAA